MNNQPQRLDVAFTIEWQAGWHVGSGQMSATVDRLLRRRTVGVNRQRVAFVPGSHIKGVLRHHCECLAAVFGADVVSPHITGREPDRSILDGFRPLAHSGLVIDRLFGSRYQGNCLVVEDAVPAGPLTEAQALQSRTMIDRVSGTTRDRALFVTEAAQPHGAALQSLLQARHPPGVLTQDGDGFPFEYGLLLAALLSLDVLGGSKSVGLGRCRIAIAEEKVTWNGRPEFPVAEAVRSFEEPEWMEMLKMLRAEETV